LTTTQASTKSRTSSRGTTGSDPAGAVAAEVAQAEQEADEASALVAALEERIRSGDDTVTAAELDDAHKLSRFARLRRDAAHRKAAAARAAQVANARTRHADQIKAAVNSGALDVRPVANAYAAMRDAVTAFVTAANAYNQAWTQARTAIDNPPHRDEDGPTLASLGVRVDTTVNGHPRVVADGVGRYPLRTAEHLARVVVDAEQLVTDVHGQKLRPVIGGMARHALVYQPDLATIDGADETAGGAA